MGGGPGWMIGIEPPDFKKFDLKTLMQKCFLLVEEKQTSR